ncbi:hypothetical protein K435DRAFT_791950 [Dendrothele bispora CBS 962.96]|uniref:Uncharacterized protein n=1 Tax=Dendrothele bispora (strain CBS 962.96) TaxID=1314807 RepID=A0A4S8MKC1_DENBC|nr:hypothetical protein K435DRAFT_791950 [Dendrothele bispora CBS 962.96]
MNYPSNLNVNLNYQSSSRHPPPDLQSHQPHPHVQGHQSYPYAVPPPQTNNYPYGDSRRQYREGPASQMPDNYDPYASRGPVYPQNNVPHQPPSQPQSRLSDLSRFGENVARFVKDQQVEVTLRSNVIVIGIFVKVVEIYQRLTGTRLLYQVRYTANGQEQIGEFTPEDVRARR